MESVTGDLIELSQWGSGLKSPVRVNSGKNEPTGFGEQKQRSRKKKQKEEKIHLQSYAVFTDITLPGLFAR